MEPQFSKGSYRGCRKETQSSPSVSTAFHHKTDSVWFAAAIWQDLLVKVCFSILYFWNILCSWNCSKDTCFYRNLLSTTLSPLPPRRKRCFSNFNKQKLKCWSRIWVFPSSQHSKLQLWKRKNAQGSVRTGFLPDVSENQKVPTRLPVSSPMVLAAHCHSTAGSRSKTGKGLILELPNHSLGSSAGSGQEPASSDLLKTQLLHRSAQAFISRAQFRPSSYTDVHRAFTSPAWFSHPKRELTPPGPQTASNDMTYT